MANKVIYPFADLLDGSYVYHVGDEYPRHGVTVSAERLEELAGSKNKLGRPLIAVNVAPTEPAKGDEGIDNTPKEEKAVKKASTAKKTAKKK